MNKRRFAGKANTSEQREAYNILWDKEEEEDLEIKRRLRDDEGSSKNFRCCMEGAAELLKW